MAVFGQGSSCIYAIRTETPHLVCPAQTQRPDPSPAACSACSVRISAWPPASARPVPNEVREGMLCDPRRVRWCERGPLTAAKDAGKPFLLVVSLVGNPVGFAAKMVKLCWVPVPLAPGLGGTACLVPFMAFSISWEA